MHVGALECEYAPECSGACIPLCVVSVCVSGCCGRRKEENKSEGKEYRRDSSGGEDER